MLKRNFSKESVYTLYNICKNKAYKALYNGNNSRCLKYIKAAAHTAYNFYLGYKDEDIEDILKLLSNKIVPCVDPPRISSDVFVVYDSFAIDNGGLVQQYLNALVSGEYEIIYITEQKKVLNVKSAIGSFLRNYDKAKIHIVPDNISLMDKAQFVYNLIIDSCASKLFIHSSPSASYACCAFYALPSSIKKYKLNLTDHTFWIGTRFIDYSFEFRPYGCNLSINKRGISKESILYLPFYPIMDNRPFEGFPQEAIGKVILFSGGNYYKIFDKEDTYFKLVKNILDVCPNMVLLYAGAGDTRLLNHKINKYQLKGRFIPIGYRSDITACFERSDIYINTYPIGGGLMSQYAAQLGKPIIGFSQYGKSRVEEHVCQLAYMNLSDSDIPSLVNRASLLYHDVEYRTKYASAIQACVITRERFNHIFSECIENNTSVISYESEDVFKEYNLSIEDKLDMENQTMDFQRSFIKILGLSSLWECPSYLINSIIAVAKDNRLFKVLMNQIFK